MTFGSSSELSPKVAENPALAGYSPWQWAADGRGGLESKLKTGGGGARAPGIGYSEA